VVSAVTVAQMRDAEAVAMAEVGGDALMQRAAEGLYRVVLRELAARRGSVAGVSVLVLAGPGNNGGDGLFAGLRLTRDGVAVSACRAGNSVHESGWAALMAAGGVEIGLDEVAPRLGEFDLVIDAIFGIGGKPGLRPPLDDLAKALAASGVPVVACDMPSGMSADPPFGVEEGAVFIRPEVTVTFGAPKLCHVTEPAKSACGRIELVDIGLTF